MVSRTQLQDQLPHCLSSISLEGLGPKIEGKVRDCYVIGDTRILIASDRLSAFDVVLTTIPFKGQLLTQLALHWFRLTEHIVKNHIIDTPHPNVMVTREVQILPIEVIVRGYLTGSAWRDYEAGNAISGVVLPPGMTRFERFETPIITPSTKAERGHHDTPIASAEIVRQGIIEARLWEQVQEVALALFAFGSQEARKQGLILVDTKYEFGLLPDGTLLIADEIHTPDCSRYWMQSSYSDRVANGQDPDMLDKEFVRRHLIQLGWMGEGTPPVLADAFRVETAEKYIQSYQAVTGTSFEANVGPVEADIRKSLSR